MTHLFRRVLLAALLPLLAACAGVEVGTPLAEVQRAAYTAPDEAPSLTLYTVIRNINDNGAHTGLLINGSQRVLFDPAGSFVHPNAPERGDVLYGVSPRIQSVYIDFHARESFRIVEQRIEVSPEVAEQALRLAMDYGPVAAAGCSRATSTILSQLPGFEDIGVSWFPNNTMEAFGRHPGVVERTITDDDADQNHGVLIRERKELIEAGLLVPEAG
ncbi:hypothetical protein EKE94_10140 [Mesobaculum littorinae]|uniref:Lipoprotein n=1 Tax=Mesobaculum littorinae TaxID=2486419 RepID=A0A438AGT6_9RHOB|nr:hypothetical protein [Mesobaculum littorinae]RVV97835.1 hypothetical protein EKE94_10140 [Mesobaculum littorinae]